MLGAGSGIRNPPSVISGEPPTTSFVSGRGHTTDGRAPSAVSTSVAGTDDTKGHLEALTEDQLTSNLTAQLKLCHNLFKEMGKPGVDKFLGKCRKAEPSDERSEELAKIDLWVARCIEMDAFKGNGSSITENDHESKLIKSLLDLCPAEQYWTRKQKLKVSMIYLGEILGLLGMAGGVAVCVDRARKAVQEEAEAESMYRDVERQPLVGEHDPARPEGKRPPQEPEPIAGQSSGPPPNQETEQGVQGEGIPEQPPWDADPDAIELHSVRRTSSSSSSATDDEANDETLTAKQIARLRNSSKGKQPVERGQIPTNIQG